HTLTQFDSVDKVKLWINGEEQNAMPVDNTPLSEGYSRANGINLDVTNKPDLQIMKQQLFFILKSMMTVCNLCLLRSIFKAVNQKILTVRLYKRYKRGHLMIL